MRTLRGALAGLLLGLAACSGSENSQNAGTGAQAGDLREFVVGRWSNNGCNLGLTFNQDGTIQGVMGTRGTWEVRDANGGSTIAASINDGEGPPSDVIGEREGDRLILVYQDSRGRREFTRCPAEPDSVGGGGFNTAAPAPLPQPSGPGALPAPPRDASQIANAADMEAFMLGRWGFEGNCDNATLTFQPGGVMLNPQGSPYSYTIRQGPGGYEAQLNMAGGSTTAVPVGPDLRITLRGRSGTLRRCA